MDAIALNEVPFSLAQEPERNNGARPSRQHEATTARKEWRATSAIRETSPSELGETRMNGNCLPLAIVGMALRLPGGAKSPDQLWDFLMEKKNGVCVVPETRYNIESFYSTTRPHTVKTQRGYFLQDDPARFDAGFFGINGYEASRMDPQQRQLLEVVWECLESAGETNWRGKRIGCYVGVYGEDWLDLASKDPQDTDRYHIIATGQFALANRLSFEYDFQGPSMTIQTGCSASLVGLHEACQALYSGDCCSAIVAGSNLIFTPTMTATMSDNMVMSPSGTCKTFDEKADGYGRGEAVNALLIKRLDDAIRNNDPVRAVIRATSTNCDGRTPSITTPGAHTQEALIRWAYEKAGVPDITQTGFFECHGTGTIAGDTIETSVVARLFGGKGVAIGSVKPSVGHGEGASGLSSVIKAVLALEHKIIPPNVFFDTPNPRIPFKDGSLHVPVDSESWPEDRSERVSVNCFGVGGANAHAILDSATSFGCDTVPLDIECTGYRLLVVSARGPDALQRRIQDLAAYVERRPENLHNLVYTLGVRREHLSHRAFAVVNSEEATKSPSLSFHFGRDYSPDLTLVFTGQGAQWPGMARELIEEFSVVRSSIEYLDQVLQELPDAPAWLLEDELRKTGDSSRVYETEFSQPLCTALQISMVDLLYSWGFKPSSVVGHSSGEIAAAFAAGALTRKSAIIISYYRGKLAKRQDGKGAMSAVGLGSAEIAPFLEEGVVVACENSPRSVTLSGDREKISTVISAIQASNPDVFCRQLRVSIAYHSHHMRDFGAEYESRIAPFIENKEITLPFFSTVSNSKITDARKLGASYWRQNLESPVLFSGAVQNILKETGFKAFLEIGAHSALSGPLRQIFEDAGLKSDPAYIPTLSRNKENSRAQMIFAAGLAHVHGLRISLASINGGTGTTLTNLPTYPWDHSRRYWHESRVTRDWRFRKNPHHELLGSLVMESSGIEPSWRNLLRLEEVQWLADHVLQGNIIFPGMAYAAMAGEAVLQLKGDPAIDDYSIKNLVIKSPLLLADSKTFEIITTLKPVSITDFIDGEWYSFSVVSNDGTGWTKHCQGLVMAGCRSMIEFDEVPKYSRALNPDLCFKYPHRLGFHYGPHFQRFQKVSVDPTGCNASASILNFAEEPASRYTLHPATMDHVLQLFPMALSHGIERKFPLVVPASVGYLYVGGSAAEASIHARVSDGGTGLFLGNAEMLAGGKLIMSASDVRGFPVDNQGQESGSNIPGISQIQWAPDIDLMSPEAVFPRTNVRKPRDEVTQAAKKLGILYSLETTACFSASNPEASQFLARYRWVAAEALQIGQGRDDMLKHVQTWAGLTSEARQSLIDNLSSTLDEDDKREFSKIAACMKYIYRNFRHITTGQGFLEDTDSCIETFKASLYSQLNWNHFLATIGHSNPVMRVLEIGSGSVFVTKAVLNQLRSPSGSPLFSRYVFTSHTAEVVAAAQTDMRHDIEFSLFDITRDPVEQGFDPHSFDLIIAFNTLRPTADLDVSLQSLHRLLAPNGRLLFHQLNLDNPVIGYIMLLMPDALIEHMRNGSNKAHLSPEDWNSRLRYAGFTGNDATFRCEGPVTGDAGLTILSSIPRELTGERVITLLARDEPSTWVRSLASHLFQEGYIIKWATLEHEPPASEWVLFLLDVEGPYLHDMSEQIFTALQTYLVNLNNCKALWVSKSSQVVCEDPRYGLISGLARTLRQEQMLDISIFETNIFDDQAITALLKVLRKLILSRQLHVIDPEYEFFSTGVEVLVGRCYWGETLRDTSIQSINVTARKLRVLCPGIIETLDWVPYDRTSLLSGQVEVKVQYVGLNFKDILVAMGMFGDMEDFGVEGSGIIQRVAHDVVDYKPGDRVAIMGERAFRTHAVVPTTKCIKLPDEISLEDAAGMPSAYTTAAYSLLELCRLQKGESVLIHSACGGVGLAAIQIAQSVGAEIFATVGNEDKVQHLVTRWGIPRHRIFNSRAAEFQNDVMRQTNGRGVDVVLNSLSGNLLHASWDCVAPFGKMVELGKRDFLGNGKLNMLPFIKNRSYFGFDLDHISKDNASLLKRIISQVYDLYINKHFITPIRPVRVYEAHEVVEAFRYMQEGVHIGKILIRIPPDPADLPPSTVKTPLSFSPNASYLLVGGLGGVGRSVSTWMVESGARSLVYLSRSAGAAIGDQAFIRELEEQGCNVVCAKGSVTNLEDVKRAISQCPRTLAGILQMSGKLEDYTFSKMTHDKWNAALATKVQGTLNLHSAVQEENLDFFVVFSSVSGTTGNPGQANYAAANTFLDSFTQYRRTLGLPSAAIVLGPVEDSGMTLQQAGLLEKLRFSSIRIVSEKQLIEGLQMAIEQARNPHSPANNVSSACIVGLGTTKPISDPGVRSPWAADARYSIFSNLASNGGSSADASSDELTIRLREIDHDATLLNERETEMIFRRGIGKKMVQHKAGADDRDDEELAALIIDSLTGIEIRNWTRRNIGVEVSLVEISKAGNVGNLVVTIIDHLKIKHGVKQAPVE